MGTVSAPSDDALGNLTDTGTFETEDGKCYTVLHLNGNSTEISTDTSMTKLRQRRLERTLPYPNHGPNANPDANPDSLTPTLNRHVLGLFGEVEHGVRRGVAVQNGLHGGLDIRFSAGGQLSVRFRTRRIDRWSLFAVRSGPLLQHAHMGMFAKRQTNAQYRPNIGPI